MPELDFDDIERRMAGAVEAFRKELASLRTGRAAASMLDPVSVNVYGADMPLNQIGTVSVPESRMIAVQIWDANNVSAASKAILNAGLGLNPVTEGNLVRVPIPDLTEERRKEYAKVAGHFAESARVAARNVRRHAMDELKKEDKAGTLSQDDHHLYGDEVQSLTDRTMTEIEELLERKQQEIMQV